MPLTQLYRLAAHLVCWKKARVIDTLTKNNVYILNPSPKADGFYLPFLSQKFERNFPVKISDILPRFSFPKKLGEHVQSLPTSLQRDFVDIVIWMLRQDLLVQQQTYVYLMVPTGGSSMDDGASDDEEKWPLTPRPLLRHELRYIEQLNNNTKEFTLFKSLCPYFRGYHHLTEIAWRENISKEELAKVIQMFKSVLVLVNHPEETMEEEHHYSQRQ
jgi:nitrogen permease regulator 3-like protein